MANPEFNDVDDVFYQITSGLNLTPPTLPRDGVVVKIDPEAGEDFRTDLFRVFTDRMCLPSLPVDTIRENLRLTGRAADEVTEGLAAYLYSPGAKVRLSGKVAITGTGLIVAAEQPGDSLEEVIYMDGSVNAFGTVMGAGYSPYPFAENAAEVQPTSTGHFSGKMLEGIVLLLGDVQLCENDGYGPVWDEFAGAAVPLPVTTLGLNKIID
jgi:hypothetical protein